MIKISINEKPLSVNKAWRGGPRYRSGEYEAYEEILLATLPKKKIIAGPVECNFRFYIKNCARTDADNLLKPLIDICVKHGYIEDDRDIFKITVEKIPAIKERIEFEIKPFEIKPYVKN